MNDKERIKEYCKRLSSLNLTSTCESLDVDVANFLKCRTTIEKMKLVKDAMTKEVLEIALKDVSLEYEQQKDNAL